MKLFFTAVILATLCYLPSPSSAQPNVPNIQVVETATVDITFDRSEDFLNDKTIKNAFMVRVPSLEKPVSLMVQNNAKNRGGENLKLLIVPSAALPSAAVEIGNGLLKLAQLAPNKKEQVLFFDLIIKKQEYWLSPGNYPIDLIFSTAP